MYIFVALIVVSAVMYLYYKVAILKTREPLSQVYFNAKARLCLGSLVFFFGINQYLFYQTRLSLFIGIVFLVLGIAQITRSYKEVKHYRNEWKRINAQ